MTTICTTCRLAEWKTTAAGKLHPSGDGRCTFVWVPPPLPASMWWGSSGDSAPKPTGGYLDRHGDAFTTCPHHSAIATITRIGGVAK